MSICSCCKNKITVNCDGLNANDIAVYLSLYASDTDYNNPILIYKDNVYYDIPNEYGENDWVIYYKDQKCTFRHFKTNRHYCHKYNFFIFEKNDTLYCARKIIGKNAENDTFCFAKK